MWNFKEGQNWDQILKDIDKTFGIENLKVNQILDADPDVEQLKEGEMRLVDDGTNLYLAIKRDGTLKKAIFS